MNKYVKLMELNTSYATRMKRLQNRIFGNPLRASDMKSLRVVQMFKEKPVYEKPEVVAYYPKHSQIKMLMAKLRYYGLYRDEHEDFTEEMRRLRAARGKEMFKKPEKK